MSDFDENTERIRTLIEHLCSYSIKSIGSNQNMLSERKATMTYDEFVEKAKKNTETNMKDMTIMRIRKIGEE